MVGRVSGAPPWRGLPLRSHAPGHLHTGDTHLHTASPLARPCHTHRATASSVDLASAGSQDSADPRAAANAGSWAPMAPRHMACRLGTPSGAWSTAALLQAARELLDAPSCCRVVVPAGGGWWWWWWWCGGGDLSPCKRIRHRSLRCWRTERCLPPLHAGLWLIVIIPGILIVRVSSAGLLWASDVRIHALPASQGRVQRQFKFVIGRCWLGRAAWRLRAQLPGSSGGVPVPVPTATGERFTTDTKTPPPTYQDDAQGETTDQIKSLSPLSLPRAPPTGARHCLCSTSIPAVVAPPGRPRAQLPARPHGAMRRRRARCSSPGRFGAARCAARGQARSVHQVIHSYMGGRVVVFLLVPAG